MRVQSVITPCINNNLSFGSLDFNSYEYVDYKGKLRKSQCTTGRRTDLNYDNAADIIIKRFRDFDNVKIMPMNVSDGTEAYFLANSIIRKVGFEEFKKRYAPICASDVYAPVIKSYPANGIVFFNKEEFSHFNNQRKILFRKVNPKIYETSVINPIDLQYKNLYKLMPDFRNCFNFQAIDLQKRLKLLKDQGNSVILIRNCLYHSFGEGESIEIIKKVASKLKGESLFIIGGFDRVKMPEFMTAMNKYFKEIDYNIFQKKVSNSVVKNSLLDLIMKNI